MFKLEAQSGVGERTKTATQSSKAGKGSHRNPANAEGVQGLFPAWLMSPPGLFGHVLLSQHSPECLSITSRNWGNRGGVGSPCVTLPSVWKQTDCSLPKSCSALHMAQGSSTVCTHRGGCWALAWERSSGFAEVSRELGMGKHSPAVCRGQASQAARKVKFRCVWIWLWVSLPCSCASRRLMMGSVCSEVLWEQTDDSVL